MINPYFALIEIIRRGILAIPCREFGLGLQAKTGQTCVDVQRSQHRTGKGGMLKVFTSDMLFVYLFVLM